ncbi:MAG: IPT/TIG domain-containing protein [Bacteroidota bacterium]
MANFYKKILIALIATGLFIGACSKSGGNNPTPNNPTPTNPNPTNPDPNPTNTTPTITSLSVTSGGFDAVVLINGTNFSTSITNNKVFFNGKAATVTAATATQLTVKVPQDAGTGAVTISVNGGATVTGPTFTYVVPAPAELKIAAIDTDKGITGATVNITGTGFSAIATENKVFFNGKAAEVIAATTTKLSVKVPEGAGIGKITVTVAGKTVEGPNFDYYFSATVTTLAGSEYASDNGADGVGAAARFFYIDCMAIDKNGNIYTVESSSYRIRKITPDGTVTTLLKNNIVNGTKYITVDNNGNIFFAGEIDQARVVRKLATDGTITNYLTPAKVIPPVTINAVHLIENINIRGLAADQLGNLFVADWFYGKIYKVNDSGVSVFAGGGNNSEIKGFNNTFIMFGFSIDLNGNLYTTNPTVTPRVTLKIDPTASITATPFKNNVTGSVAAVDKNGNVYSWTNISNTQIRVTDKEGVTSVIAGDKDVSGFRDGDQFTAQFNGYQAPMVVDRAGNLYVGQRGSVKKVSIK